MNRALFSAFFAPFRGYIFLGEKSCRKKAQKAQKRGTSEWAVVISWPRSRAGAVYLSVHFKWRS